MTIEDQIYIDAIARACDNNRIACEYIFGHISLQEYLSKELNIIRYWQSVESEA